MNSEESNEMESTLRTPRVFINHMDSYHGKILSDNLSNNPDTTVLDPHNKEDFLKKLLSCALVIYDITLDDGQIHEAEWALEALLHALDSPEYPTDDDKPLHFLLISPIMTWARTKQLDPQNSDAPLNELDYRKRVPHPNFTRHKNCESRVISVGEKSMLREKWMEKLKPLVLCCGVTYGDEEGPLHFLFKLSWKNVPFLPVFGAGSNKIPLLHVADMSRIVHSLFYKWPEDRLYLVASEINAISQTCIVENISRHMSTGEVKNVESLEDSIFKGNISQRDLDVMMMDVNIEPAYTVDHNMQEEKTFDMQVERIVNEYRVSRNLQPVKIIIMGPPASGKTTLARRIAQYYGITYISEEALIGETIRNLTTALDERSWDVETPEYSKDRDNKGDNEQRVVAASRGFISKRPSELQRLLDEIRNNLSLNNGHPTDDIMNKLLSPRLQSPECTNQGYILDDYPRTLHQARELFNNKITTTNATSSSSHQNTRIFPELLVQLDATDEFLYNRVLNLPESVIQGTHYNVESMVKRLGEYRRTNMGRVATGKFFIENGAYPLILHIETVGMEASFQRCIETIGEPRNYGPTAAERVAEAVVRDVGDVRGTSAIESKGEEKVDFQRKVTLNEDVGEWKMKIENRRREEEDRLKTLSEPLRLYLVKYTCPTLIQGLRSVVESRPSDPLDFLASYLFRNNPEGKMMEISAQLVEEMDGNTSTDATEDFFEEGSDDIEF